VPSHAGEKKGATPNSLEAAEKIGVHLDTSASKNYSSATTLSKTLKIIEMIFDMSRLTCKSFELFENYFVVLLYERTS
jgi:hypothetical protein